MSNLKALARSIGLEVRRQRTALGITQKQLADQAGVSERLVRSLEMGSAYGIGLEKLVRILSVVDLDLTLTGYDATEPREVPASVRQGDDYSNALQSIVAQWTASATNGK